MRLVTIDGSSRRISDGWESELVIRAAGRRVRLGLFYGSAPGSIMAGKHMTAWRTSLGDLRGVNVRAGWWPRPCLTFLAHSRPLRKDGS